IRALQLLLSGDIEENPGPMSKEQEKQLNIVVSSVQSLEKGQAEVLATLGQLREDLNKSDAIVASLSARVAALEKHQTVTPDVKEEITAATQALSNVRRELTVLGTRCEDSENRQRRSNLLFYGLSDKEGETWAESEKLVLDICSAQLGLPLEPGIIERAHRIGRFGPDKKRPVIVKFCSTKQKDLILGKAYKFKGTAFAVSEDFSPAVREARRELLQFARPQNKPFKLKFNKLLIGTQIFVYNPESESVVEDRHP
ncbi:unnamed protein product, partial [Ixodes persulcatus]